MPHFFAVIGLLESIRDRDARGRNVVPHLGRIALAIVATVSFQTATLAGETPSEAAAADVAAIRAAAAAYREALAGADEAAIQAAWTAEGDIVDSWGNRLLAQDPKALTAGVASGPRPEFRFGESRVRFITPDVAIEDGSVDAILPGMQNPIEGWFSAVWVRQEATWKLASVREAEQPLPAGEDTLADLDWMVGDWKLEVEAAESDASADKKAASAMEMRVRWDAGRMFLIREARVPLVDGEGADGEGFLEIHQQIGWDPDVRRIRSWSFSSDGSRSEATWFRDGGSWVAMRTAVLPTGRRETAVSIYTYDGEGRCVWRVLPEALEGNDGLPTKATWVRTAHGDGE
jgi:hypothetical protein